MPLRRKDVRAPVTADFSSARRVAVQSSLARQTWVMAERERLEARRCGMSVSRGEGAVGVAGSRMGFGEGGWREEVEEAMVGGAVAAWCARRLRGPWISHACVVTCW